MFRRAESGDSLVRALFLGRSHGAGGQRAPGSSVTGADTPPHVWEYPRGTFPADGNSRPGCTARPDFAGRLKPGWALPKASLGSASPAPGIEPSWYPRAWLLEYRITSAAENCATNSAALGVFAGLKTHPVHLKQMRIMAPPE